MKEIIHISQHNCANAFSLGDYVAANKQYYVSAILVGSEDHLVYFLRPLTALKFAFRMIAMALQGLIFKV